MARKIFIVVAVILLKLTALYAQTLPYYHYTTAEGLASSTVFDIIQDHDGFLWFATSNGMSRFDGSHFTTFTVNNGLNSNSVMSLLEREKGTMYIGTYEKGINVFTNGRIENYCSTIDGKNFWTSYLVSSGGKLYAYHNTQGIQVIGEKTPGGRVAYQINTRPLHMPKLEKLSNGDVIALTREGVFNFNNDTFTRLHIKGLEHTGVFSFTRGPDSTYFVGSKGMICEIKNNAVVKKYIINLRNDNTPFAMLRDRNNNIWFSIMNKGFFVIPNGSDEIINIGKTMNLGNIQVNHYLEDNEGNIWISTLGKGVYCLHDFFLRSFSENDGLSSNNVYSVVKVQSGKIVIGTFNGINVLEHGIFYHIKSNQNKELTDYIHRIKCDHDTVYVCGAFGITGSKKFSSNGLKFSLFERPSFCKTSNGILLFGTWGNFIQVQKELKNLKAGSSWYYIFGDSGKLNRVNEIVEDVRKNIWIGTSLGLCKVSRWQKSFFPSDPVLASRIVGISQDSQSNVWFAGEKGIACYNLDNDSVTSYTNIFGYDVSSSTSIAFDSKNRLWIGTMNGLYVYDGTSIKYLNTLSGLPSNEIFSLCYDRSKNIFYVGTNNGMTVIDVALFDNYHSLPLTVKILGVKAGDSVYASYNNLEFEPEHNNVSIDFKALNFSSPGSVKYQYVLNGKSVETGHDFLNFLALEHGTYSLEIRAKLQNTDWGKASLVTFRVKPRFTETVWFFVAIIFVGAAGSFSLVLGYMKRKNKKIREQFKLTERINELKHQALSAMMNPHFIFNSLNSVQYLINSERNEEANNYIGMMATLMRKNLDTAGSGFILLSEEINRLTLYLDLEKLRFQESFSYEISTGSDVDIDSIMIPNMIIQPFVENTLWHGIIHSGKKGLVSVSFSFADVEIDSTLSRSLIIKVTDNGIGIKESKKNKKEDHISKGIQIVEERLKLLSEKMDIPQPIMLEDLGSRNNDSHGTEVIISLPEHLYKIISPASREVHPSSPAD